VSTEALSRPTLRTMLNKVPEVTLYFWIIKILCTTVGETIADYLTNHFGAKIQIDGEDALSLVKPMIITGVLLAIVLAAQFAFRKYIPFVYWLAVVLISVFGTQLTDYLHDERGVTLATTTIIFSITLAVVFAIWFAVERTLSIHTIVTSRREGFYWLAVLATFALGTAAGDYFTDGDKFLPWLLAFAGGIALIFAAHRFLKVNAILAFWAAYILTRPLGAAIGDYLSQPKIVDDVNTGGLDWGPANVSWVFLGLIAATVTFLTVTRLDRTPPIDPANLDGTLAATGVADGQPRSRSNPSNPYPSSTTE
jgi:uncharacterized membrane-anchored protein